MGWINKVMKKAAVKLIEFVEKRDDEIRIKEPLSYATNVLKNRIWYRGDPSELDQFFKRVSSSDEITKQRFWAARPSDGHGIRKIHSGLPQTIIDVVAGITGGALESVNIQFPEKEQKESENPEDAEKPEIKKTNPEETKINDLWEEIAKDNEFDELLENAVADALIVGDGAFKISYDTALSEYPIIEFFSGEQVEYVERKGRIEKYIFSTPFKSGNKEYVLKEIYKKGQIEYEVTDAEGKPQDIKNIPEYESLEPFNFSGDFILAEKMTFFKSPKWKGRGRSIYENKTDDFDKLDETISQWVDAVRKGRAMRYIPDNMIPYDDDLNPMKPNPFDNDFVALTNMMGEDEKGKIQTEQAEIRSAEYAATYSNDLDVCLQGIVSPSTLGIDLKKTDNAEAQREKEKTTLHTRKKIMKVLKKVVPRIIETTLKTYDVYKELPEREFEVNATFGEYAAPDFDSVVETIGKAKTYQIMSTKMAIDKLYNETLSDEEKAEELARIQEETSLNAIMDEPVLYSDGDQDDEKEEKEEKPKKDKKAEDQEKAKGE